ncbi:MAG: rhodanese-like domain-containing protein [Steroidobacteraceae bacterium]
MRASRFVRGFGVLAAAVLAAAFAFAAEPVAAPVTQEALVERQQQADADLVVLDVRSPDEFAAGHVPGAINIPHERIAERLAEVPRDKDVILYCQSGRRAGIAAQALAEQGYTRLFHLEGDIAAWKANGRPLE